MGNRWQWTVLYVKYDYSILREGAFMEKVVSATDMVRKFSEILNSIKYKGDCYTVV
jgi:hypothetical protein